jgi:hypothetical protein
MAARAGMTDLIESTRGMCDVGYADYTIGTTSYWNDDVVQKVLDRHRNDIKHMDIEPETTYLASGTIQFKDYYIGYGNLESGTAFWLEDATGADIGGTAYGVDYDRGLVSFNYDTLGSSVFVNTRAFDLNAAAADIWRHKAANTAKMYSFSAGGQSLQRGQFMQNCIQMATYYEGLAAPTNISLYRSDCTPAGIEEGNE